MSDSESEKGETPVVKPSDSSDSSYDDEEEYPVHTKDESRDEHRTLVELETSTETMARIPKPMPPVAPGQPLPRRKRFIPNYDIEGVYRVELNEDIQIQIEILVGTDVNGQYPWKFVKKQNILDNIHSLDDKSPFHPFTQELKDYPGAEILMGYIPDDSKDVLEFYICVTETAKNHCKQQSDRFMRRQERKLLKSISKKAGPWTSLGSEVEIIEQIPIPSRKLMEIEIKAKFPTVYDPEKLVVRETQSVRDGYIELTPYRLKINNVYRRRVSTAAQIGLPKRDAPMQTVLRYPKNMWTQSIADSLGSYNPDMDLEEFFKKETDSDEDSSSDEGGTAAEHFVYDKDGFAAFRNAYRRLRRPSYIKLIDKFMGNYKNDFDDIIELNTVMDIYSNDYPKLVKKQIADIYDTMTFSEYICFTDVRAKDKYVSCAVFHPMWTGIVAVCYSDGSPNIMKSVSTRPDPIQRAVYGLNPVMIWSHVDSLLPKLYLECTREVKTLSFCPFDPNLLLGGCINGQLVLWDITNKLENVEVMEVLNEKREKYKIAVNAHMDWFKNTSDAAFVPATAMSSLLTSHYGAINAICWVSPNFTLQNSGRQDLLTADEPRSLMVFTGSEDGTIQAWNLSPDSVTSLDVSKKVKKSKRILQKPEGLTTDISPYQILDRNLQPLFRIMTGVAGHPETLPIQSMSLTPPLVKYIHIPSTACTGRKYFKCEIIPQKESDVKNILYYGTQHGEFKKIAWEGTAYGTGDFVNTEYEEILFKCNVHDGIISCTERNPFLDHITLTCGGKVFAIWSSKLNGRPLIWKKRPFRLTDAKWSLYKASLLFVATSEGDLETWDLLLRSDVPVSVQTVSGSILTGVALHSLHCPLNIIGVSDSYGSFNMFINPPIFQLQKAAYTTRMDHLINRELKVMNSFLDWQNEWMIHNPEVLLEIKRKEGALLAEKEEEKRKLREQEDQRLEEEAEAKRLEKLRVIGPAERWQMMIQSLIERAIAVKKRIDRAQLILDEMPLRELDIQRLEKEKRMLEIIKNQKNIFNDTVAILFPEAIQKPPKIKKSYLEGNREKQKENFFGHYLEVRSNAKTTVRTNPYKSIFSWEAFLAEGKERRQSLSPYEWYSKIHMNRIDNKNPPKTESVKATVKVQVETEGEEISEPAA